MQKFAKKALQVGERITKGIRNVTEMNIESVKKGGIE